MTIGESIRQGLHYARTCKSLWLFGFFVGIASGGGSGGGGGNGGGGVSSASAAWASASAVPSAFRLGDRADRSRVHPGARRGPRHALRLRRRAHRRRRAGPPGRHDVDARRAPRRLGALGRGRADRLVLVAAMVGSLGLLVAPCVITLRRSARSAPSCSVFPPS